MYILVNKIDKEIKSFSDNTIEYDESIFDLMEVPNEDLSGNKCKYEDGQIKKELIVSTKKVTKEDIDGAKSLDELKEIIKDLIK